MIDDSIVKDWEEQYKLGIGLLNNYCFDSVERMIQYFKTEKVLYKTDKVDEYIDTLEYCLEEVKGR